MKISKSDLYRIVVEEYIKEENIAEADQAKVDALLKQIRGEEPEPDDETKFIRTHGKPADDATTYAMDKPASVEAEITNLVKDMGKAEVANLFNAIYEKIKEQPGTMPDYGGLAENKSNDSAVAWDELKDIIREVMAESV